VEILALALGAIGALIAIEPSLAQTPAAPPP